MVLYLLGQEIFDNRLIFNSVTFTLGIHNSSKKQSTFSCYHYQNQESVS